MSLKTKSLSSALAAGVAATVIAMAACGNAGDASKNRTAASPVIEKTFAFPDGPWGENPVVVTIPKTASAKNRLPVLVALHGQGESRKTPAKGARGWPEDYEMIKAMERLAHPPLTREDFGGMVADKRLAALNASLAQRPYRGLIVACPYLPDRFRTGALHDDAAIFGTFLVKNVMPRIYKETPAIGTPETTGIDGVSLGGRASVTVGLGNPSTFGAVGGTQAAFGPKQIPGLVWLLTEARRKRRELPFRLLSSEKDRFRKVTLEISEALKKQDLPHQVDIVKGDHSYAFNRGPGVFEMLLYYDRVLRGEPYLTP